MTTQANQEIYVQFENLSYTEHLLQYEGQY